MARKEFRSNERHPAYVELQQIADAMGSSLQEVISVQVIARSKPRHGLPTLHAVTWLGAPPVPAAEPRDADPVHDAGAQGLADAWL